MPLFADNYPHISGAGGKSDISVRHLLTMSSGLSSCVGESDGEAILKMRASYDWVRAWSSPIWYKP